MSEQNQSGANHLQSSAIVAAAFITTLGAITAACIQTGWLGKPTGDLPLPSASTSASTAPLVATMYPTNSFGPSYSISDTTFKPSSSSVQLPAAAKRAALATFTGTIEPVDFGPPSTTVKPHEPVAKTIPQVQQQFQPQPQQQRPPELFWGAGDVSNSNVTPVPTVPSKTAAPTARPINAIPVSAMMPIDPPATFATANLAQPSSSKQLLAQPTTIPSLLDSPNPKSNQAVSLPATALSSANVSTIQSNASSSAVANTQFDSRPQTNAGVQPLVSPWSSMQQSLATQQPDATKATKKSFDWASVTHFFKASN